MAYPTGTYAEKPLFEFAKSCLYLMIQQYSIVSMPPFSKMTLQLHLKKLKNVKKNRFPYCKLCGRVVNLKTFQERKTFKTLFIRCMY